MLIIFITIINKSNIIKINYSNILYKNTNMQHSNNDSQKWVIWLSNYSLISLLKEHMKCIKIDIFCLTYHHWLKNFTQYQTITYVHIKIINII